MQSVREISDFSGFSRDALTTRVKRWGLKGADICFKAFFDLKPLDAGHASKISLEDQRTLESEQATRLKKLQADEKEGILADVEALMEAQNELHEGIAAIVKRSGLPEAEKEDILTAIRDHAAKWGEGFGC